MDCKVGIPPATDDEERVVAWAKTSIDSGVVPIWINRPKKCTPDDVKFEMLYCGICHTDCTVALNLLGNAVYPCVPGHELLGQVTEVGSNVTKLKVGDKVGVGYMVDSCLDCAQCKLNDEQYCDGGFVSTLNDTKKHTHIGGHKDAMTWGGYSGAHVVHQNFVAKIPDGLDLEKSAPILCAGITMYDPLRHWGATKGHHMTIGIVGVGGLGTMGIKLAKALGHTVMAISTTAAKEELAKSKGADLFVASKDPESCKAGAGKCDLIINTVSADHDLNVYLPLVATNGTLVQIGLITKPHSVSQLDLILKRKQIAGSLVGGMAATQECLDLCAKHQIYPDCTTITADKIDFAWDQLCTGINKDGIRYVIDCKASIANGVVPK